MYTGREFDSETGLQYNRGRYYDATTGRWISQDPLGFSAGDSNLYRYVANSPTNGTDPSGLYLGAISYYFMWRHRQQLQQLAWDNGLLADQLFADWQASQRRLALLQGGAGGVNPALGPGLGAAGLGMAGLGMAGGIPVDYPTPLPPTLRPGGNFVVNPDGTVTRIPANTSGLRNAMRPPSLSWWARVVRFIKWLPVPTPLLLFPGQGGFDPGGGDPLGGRGQGPTA